VTQADLAKAVGASPTSVSEWEADKKVPREETLARIATYLGVTPAYLRYGSEVFVPPANLTGRREVPNPDATPNGEERHPRRGKAGGER
jgi:transcriptional regulator with XRE-family HTH domain